MISKKELDDRLKGAIATVKSADPLTMMNVLFEHLQYCAEHYEELDFEGKKIVDDSIEIMKDEFCKGIQSMPEGLEKRKVTRQYAKIESKHHDITDFMSLLEQPPKDHLKIPITLDAKALFKDGMQCILDFLFDVGQHSLGPPLNVCFGLFFLCVDELLAGMHLAQHAYCTQSYSHVRSVIECLGKIELFVQKPQWIDLWSSDDEKKIYEELRPSAVRKKLGNPKRDEMYNFLSQLGSHPSFKGLQARMVFSKKESDDAKRVAHIWYGGSPQLHHMLWAQVNLLHTVLFVMMKVVSVFEEYLNRDEVLTFTTSFGRGYIKYLIDHFIPWAKENGLKVEDFEKHVHNFLRTLIVEK